MDVKEVEGLIESVESEKELTTTTNSNEEEVPVVRRRLCCAGMLPLIVCCSCFLLLFLGGIGSLLLVDQLGLFSTSEPSAAPTATPSVNPTNEPTTQPSHKPSQQPTRNPTQQPSLRPSQYPSQQPTIGTQNPTQQPTQQENIPKIAMEPSSQQVSKQTNEPKPNEETIIADTVDSQNIDNPNVDWGPSHYGRKSSIVYRPLTEEESYRWAEHQHWEKWEPIERPSVSFPNLGTDFPNHDIPMSEFPAGSWQLNGMYLEPWLRSLELMTVRAMNAILIEYGKNGVNVPYHLDARVDSLFEYSIVKNGEGPYRTKRSLDQGGWMNNKDYDGLTRRLLHTLVTGDPLRVVIAGGEAATGKGNMFRQSLAMQFHKIMEPVLASADIELVTQNLAHDLGTLPSAFGFADLYGDPDIILWEGDTTDVAALDLFLRQALLSGNKVPFLFLNQVKWGESIFEKLHAYTDVYFMGSATNKLDECTSCDCKNLPWAGRFLKCKGGCEDVCAEHKWRSNCWVDRPDVTPRVKQEEHPVRDDSLPGFRNHQLSARLMTMIVLRCLRRAASSWNAAIKVEGYTGKLSDDEWHVTSYFAEIRQKLRETDGESECIKSENWPSRMCSLPMRARTEFTPRANPEQTSITGILKLNENDSVPHITKGMLYTGPDVANPMTAIPSQATDVLAIVSNGRVFDDDRRLERISPGRGVQISGDEPAGYCDGTFNSECSRRGSCLLSGYQYSRGGLLFRNYTEWLVVTLPVIKEGLIMTRIESRHDPSYKAAGEVDGRSLFEHDDDNAGHRLLTYAPRLCDTFAFEFSINGNITVWNKNDWTALSKKAQRDVEVQTLLDDSSFTNEPKDVEVAFRFSGCGNVMTMSLTHIYFA